MRYKALLTWAAREDFAKLPIKLQFNLLADINKLCKSPTLLSKPAPIMIYPSGGQYAQFLYEVDGTWHLCTVLFQYMPNESELAILSIGREESDERPLFLGDDEP